VKKHLLTLLLLSSCAGQSPHLAEQPADVAKFQSDLAACQDWAVPTRHEMAMRCQANGDMVFVTQLIASLSGPDPRDKDSARQSMPNDTRYRLDVCLRAKGYKIDMPDDPEKMASR